MLAFPDALQGADVNLPASAQLCEWAMRCCSGRRWDAYSCGWADRGLACYEKS